MEQEDFLSKYLNQRRIEQRQKTEMKVNNDYINWLERFTTIYNSFSDDSWIYNPTEILQNDHENVNKLHLLYHIIEEYAEKNYIYPNKCDFGNYYSIKYNDVQYNIGIMCGQGTCFFCNRTTNQKEYINFKDIQTNTPNPRVKFINYSLKTLESTLDKMISSNIPIPAIEKVMVKKLKK